MCLSLPTAQRAHAGIVAKVGSDLPASLRHVITSSGADLTGLRTVDHPQVTLKKKKKKNKDLPLD
jgi:hypothetical protein